MTSPTVHVEGMSEQNPPNFSPVGDKLGDTTAPAVSDAAQSAVEPTEPAAPGDGTTDPAAAGTDPLSEPDTFPRAYVENLRRESAGYRDRAKLADETMSRLAAATVQQATGTMLADPTDLPYDPATMADESGFPDPSKITEAARQLIERKPHLASRKPSGDAGQGPRTAAQQVDLAGILRARAG